MTGTKKIVAVCVVIIMIAAAVGGIIALNELGKSTKYTNISDVKLQILGNANEDDIIDQRDIDLINEVISGEKIKGDYTDANNDGVIDSKDIDQVNKIINREKTILHYMNCDGIIASVHTPANKIVVAYSNNAEMVRVLGASDMVVAVDDQIKNYPNYLAEFKDTPSVGSRYTMDVETILELNPDIVFTGTTQWYSPDLEENLNAKGVTIDVVRLPSWEYNLVAAGILTLGYIIGHQDEAYEYLEWQNNLNDMIEDRLKSIPDSERINVFVHRNATTTVGVGSGYSEVVELAGGINIAKGMEGTYPTFEREWVLGQQPDYIIGILMTGGYEGTDSSVLQNRLDELISEYGFTPAIMNGNVHTVHYDIVQGAGYPAGVCYLAKWLYPELFADLDPVAIHQEFIDRFCVGLDYDVTEMGVFQL